jgi:CRISPR-associated protein Cst2
MPRRAFIASVIKVTGNVNADIGVGTRIPLKKILTMNQETKAFVSARCIRRCIREQLFERGFSIDPLHLIGPQGREQLGDVGDPITHIDDDLFGYLAPETVPRRRAGPVKISHLISLRHTEIKPEFAARFPREFLPDLPEQAKGYPVPFEIELAEWLGRLDIIISDRIGCFEEAELKDDHKARLHKRDGRYYLPDDERRKRLGAFLEVICWNGWQFPRAAQSPSVPEFHYSVIALTEHFTPIFRYVDVDEKEKLSEEGIENLKRLYSPFIKSLFVLDYAGQYRKFEGDKEERNQLDANSIRGIINEICNYIIPSAMG